MARQISLYNLTSTCNSAKKPKTYILGYTSILGCRPSNSPIFFTKCDLLKLLFTRCLSIFPAIDQKKGKQKSTDQIFLQDVTDEKKLSLCGIHTHS